MSLATLQAFTVFTLLLAAACSALSSGKLYSSEAALCSCRSDRAPGRGRAGAPPVGIRAISRGALSRSGSGESRVLLIQEDDVSQLGNASVQRRVTDSTPRAICMHAVRPEQATRAGDQSRPRLNLSEKADAHLPLPHPSSCADVIKQPEWLAGLGDVVVVVVVVAGRALLHPAITCTPSPGAGDPHGPGVQHDDPATRQQLPTRAQSLGHHAAGEGHRFLKPLFGVAHETRHWRKGARSAAVAHRH